MNKLILITGGSSGIGKSTAKLLHQLGARIILQARDEVKLKEAVSEISPSGERISYYSTDLTNIYAVQHAAELICKNEGIPDVVVNSAGAGEWLSFKESDLSHFRETIDSPYLLTAFTCRVFYQYMIKRGSGQFVIINSAASHFAFAGSVGYSGSRWALRGFTKSLQADLRKSGLIVSQVIFGKVDSPYFKNNPISEERIPKISNWLTPTLSTKEAGSVIVKTIKRSKKNVVKPLAMGIFMFLNRFFPGVFRLLMRLTSYKS